MSFRVILSSNRDSNYLPYWPEVARAWRGLFRCTPTLAFVDESDAGIAELGRHGVVVHLRPYPDVPVGNQAKVARLFLAGCFRSEVCMINDVDLLPLQDTYFMDMLERRIPGDLMCVGPEVYVGREQGKFPIAYMTGESHLFTKLANPNFSDFSCFIRGLIGHHLIDDKEDITNPLPPGHADCFSDESLVRALLVGKGMSVFTPARGFDPYSERAIDRQHWQWSDADLQRGRYVEAHLPHPYSADKIAPLMSHLFPDGRRSAC